MNAPARRFEVVEPLIRQELSAFGLRWLGQISWNEPNARLVQRAIARHEGQLSASGALVVQTGKHTGRSPKDKFIVRNDANEASVDWSCSQAMSPAQFAALHEDMVVHARLKDLFVQDLVAAPGSNDPLQVRVITETAWASLFMRHLLKPSSLEQFTAQLTIVCLPSFKANPARHGTAGETVIAADLASGLVLIGGTSYAGEMKKSVFTVLNHMLPAKGILSMHCSANMAADGSTALFFGLSGTGKTTLSADPARGLIGDDEHGWNDEGIFNIESGCYAKAINLDPLQEPAIHKAALDFGTVLENLSIDEATGQVNFADASRTENTRAAYDLNKIANAIPGMLAPHPKVLVMLTADAFGVLPPVAVLSHEQAIEQFLLGYTAKLAGTENGVKEPQATFSACFGAPFLTRKPEEYAGLLRAKLKKHGTRCYLLNTGWTGGAYGTGQRMALSTTRALLAAILDGSMDKAEVRKDPVFGFNVPVAVNGVDAKLLNPRQAWSDPEAYDKAAEELKLKFAEADARAKDV